MKRFLLFTILICFVGFNLSIAGTYSGGEGTAENPYLISSAADIDELMSTSEDWASNFILTQDIDCSDYTFVGTNNPQPIGNSGGAFTGFFNGQNHTISNITINTVDWLVGFFGQIWDPGTVIYLHLENISSNMLRPMSIWEGTFTGVFCGRNHGIIKGCSASGTATGNGFTAAVGGFCGYNIYGIIKNCTANVDASNGTNVGGFCGDNERSTIEYCISNGNAENSYQSGGFCGTNTFYSIIKNCYSTGSASGSWGAGSFCELNRTEIIECFSFGTASSNGSAGGFSANNWPRYSYNCCFWNSTANPELEDTGDQGDIGEITSLTDNLFEDQSSFPCFDFVNTWEISDELNYPVLLPNVDAPIITSPNDMECISDEILNIKWIEVFGAVSYQLQISFDPEFTDIVYDNDGITTTELQLNLSEYIDSYRHYFVRVRALVDNTYYIWSDKHSFSTAYTIEGDLTLNLQDVSTCQGSPVQLGSIFMCNDEVINNTITGGSGYYLIQWYPRTGLANSRTGNPTVLNPQASRRYICRVYDYITGELVQEEMYLTVIRKPIVRMASRVTITEGESYSLGERMQIYSDTPDDLQYFWTDNNGWTSTDTNPVVSPTSSTRYYLTVTDGDGCESRQYPVIVYVRRAKETYPENQIADDMGNFVFYPNPAYDQLNIVYTFEGAQELEFRIENIMGQVLYSKELNGNSNEENIDVSNYSNGMYIIRLNVDGKVFSKKFIKQ